MREGQRSLKYLEKLEQLKTDTLVDALKKNQFVLIQQKNPKWDVITDNQQ